MNRTAEAEVILELAMQQPAGERQRFLAAACADPALLAELIALLPYAEGNADFLHSPVPRPVMPDLIKLNDGSLRDRAVAELSGLPELIGGYRLIRFLGCGGMGMTFEARQRDKGRAVALKVLHPGPINPESLRLFHSEVWLLQRLTSPGIVKLFAAGIDQLTDPNGRPHPLPFLAMELIDGERLDRFNRRPELSPADRLRVFIRICRAVDHVHRQGVIHLDLKPSNVLVQRNGKPKIVDFGIGALISTVASKDAPTMKSQLGSLAYMSPERLRGAPPIGVAADVYSLGVILDQLLAGNAGDLSRVVHRATASDSALRHPSAAALAAEVRAVLRRSAPKIDQR